MGPSSVGRARILHPSHVAIGPRTTPAVCAWHAAASSWSTPNVPCWPAHFEVKVKVEVEVKVKVEVNVRVGFTFGTCT